MPCITIPPFLVFAGRHELIAEVLGLPRAPGFLVDGADHQMNARIRRCERKHGPVWQGRYRVRMVD